MECKLKSSTVTQLLFHKNLCTEEQKNLPLKLGLSQLHLVCKMKNCYRKNSVTFENFQIFSRFIHLLECQPSKSSLFSLEYHGKKLISTSKNFSTHEYSCTWMAFHESKQQRIKFLLFTPGIATMNMYKIIQKEFLTQWFSVRLSVLCRSQYQQKQ